RATLTFLTATVGDPQRLGRVVRRPDGHVEVVEWADATAAERDIREVNAGIYCFQAAWLSKEIERLTLSQKGEYYLTELVGRASPAATVEASNMEECVGIDTRAKLAEVERIVQDRLR